MFCYQVVASLSGDVLRGINLFTEAPISETELHKRIAQKVHVSNRYMLCIESVEIVSDPSKIKMIESGTDTDSIKYPNPFSNAENDFGRYEDDF